MKRASFNIGSLLTYFCLLLAAACLFMATGCNARNDGEHTSTVAMSGVHEVRTKVETGADGLTTEQRNVRDRLAIDNKPGSIKHLYVVSAYSGDVLIYSTVRGKVTSSGKRLSPTTVAAGISNSSNSVERFGIPVVIGDKYLWTGEVLQDDGTYGHSIEYLFWFDANGVYHQHYPDGGQIIHVSDQPLRIKKPIINMEVAGESTALEIVPEK